ncbi:hypothetical protein T01_14475 [Trichinella spiralis]|uniref:Uncharacterized protein n=1 Tax=Trichinella spiralis TaxID=6334 RepID=A0A0V0YXQ3_TRISP|nr:hypothetical protein T01_14475 [Trichinella spiralis]
MYPKSLKKVDSLIPTDNHSISHDGSDCCGMESTKNNFDHLILK